MPPSNGVFTTPAQPARLPSSTSPAYQMSSVYVDNFLLAAVDTKDKVLQRTARATLNAIHRVFPSPAAWGTPDAKDPISEKKIAKGDAPRATSKEIVGYMLKV
jgi:hypothetical protein